MVEKVLWPAFFDAALPRRLGRRAPLELAVEEPSVEEVAEAVGQVGYDAVIERDVAYPPEHHRQRGRVLVKDAEDATKSDLVQATAAYVAALRE
jgi:signal recognition particle subunit SRP19